MTGTLPAAVYMVATPIGNLDDMTPRARSTLEGVAVVYAEDTRRTGSLLRHLGIRTELRSYHAHNEHGRVSEILASLEQGRAIAVVSDAGTPGVSDPGAVIAEAAHRAGHNVVPIPGASALAAALSVAGFTGPALFLGFLATKGAARSEGLDRINSHDGPVVLFEGPHRASATLDDLAARCPGREICVGREITKMHEEVRRGKLAEASSWFDPPRGEFTFVVGPPSASQEDQGEVDIAAAVAKCFDAGLSAKDAASAVSALLGVRKKEAYRVAIAQRSE